MGLNHKRRTIFIIIGIQTCVVIVVIQLGIGRRSGIYLALSPTSQFEDSEYVRNPPKLLDMNLLINTTNCHIPAFSPSDEKVIPPHVEKNCADEYQNWSHVDGETLVLEVEKMSKSKLPFGKKLSCCYKTIKRAGVKSKNRDWVVSVSNCTPIITARIQMPSEFVVVECYQLNGNSIEIDPKYRSWHGIATTVNNERQDLIKKKIQFFEKQKEEQYNRLWPPSIVVIGHGSTSRLNFRRQMPSTLKFLEDLGAVEMLGYTRVGESTYHNFCASLTGYDADNYQKLCVTDPKTMKQDDCPFVWKRFDAANYLTAHIEDEPNWSTFHLEKLGFASQQVDFNTRPLFLHATHQYWTDETNKKSNESSEFKFAAPCINHQTTDQAMLSYLESVMDFGENKSIPVFSILFATYATHEDFNGLRLGDDTYASFLQKMKDKGRLDNTILIVMGDQGMRVGSMKKTLVGNYEKNLPNLWIYLPTTIRNRFPKWQDALEINSRRLTSPFNMYWTLNHILDTFTITPPPKDVIIPSPKSVTPSRGRHVRMRMSRKYRHSFFRRVSEKNLCTDVGVPSSFCSCNLTPSIT